MWMNGLFLPEFMFITHFHLVILDLRLDWSFSQRRSWVIVSWELFFGFPIPDCYYLSLQKKKHTPFMTFFLVCKRRQGRNEMWGHLIPSFPFTSLSLSGFLFLLFSYNFAFPKVRTIMAYGVAAHFWGFGQRWFGQPVLPITLTLTRFRVWFGRVVWFFRKLTWPLFRVLFLFYVSNLYPGINLIWRILGSVIPRARTNFTCAYVYCIRYFHV